MRIGFYTPNYPGLNGEGGIGSYTQTLGHGLVERGHQIYVLTPGEGKSVNDGPISVHFTATHHLPGFDKLLPGAGACWRVGRAIHRMVREEKLDLVELPNWEGYGLYFIQTTRTPTVVRLHTSSKETQIIDGTPLKRWHRWNITRERLQANSANILVTHSAAHRQLMANELNVASNTIRLIPHGIPVFPDFVRPERPDQPPTVVYLGRLEHRKGTVELLQAVPRVLESVPDARFILIGADRPHAPGGRLHAEYLASDFSQTVQSHVTLAGRLPQDHVDRWLQTADLFVAPSRYESFGLIFAEAMRWGTPVVGTTAGGIPEIVEHNQTGVLVEPESPNMLADAIAQLLLDPAKRTRLGSAGRLRIETEFSTQRMAERVEKLYAELIASKGRPRATR